MSILPAYAGVEQIVADFKPLSAYIVMDMQGEYLLDKDASHGVSVGDIFAAVSTGEKIVHPVTGEVLGTLDQVRAQMRVTKVKSGYSYAVPLAGSSKLKAGDVVVRFQGLPATFWDYTGEGESLHTSLKASMPALDWSDYAAAQLQKPEMARKVDGLEGLVFILTARGLDVKDATFQSIRFYSAADLAKEGISIAAAPAPVALPVAVSRSQTVPPAAAPASVSDPVSWYGPRMSGKMTGVVVGNLNEDALNEVAIAMEDRVLVGQFQGTQFTGSGSIDIDKKYRILTIDGVDLNNDGKLELYMTASEKEPGEDTDNVRSLYVEEENGVYKVRQKDIPYLLGSVNLPQEGRVLIGQRQKGSEMQAYQGKVYRMKLDDGEIERGEELDLPSRFITVHGFTYGKTDNGTDYIAMLDANEKLQLLDPQEGEKLWKRSDSQGGRSVSLMQLETAARSVDGVSAYLKMRLDSLDNGLIFVPQNEGSTMMQNWRDFSDSTLVAYRWDGVTLKEAWSSDRISGEISDYTFADIDNDGVREMIMAVITQQSSMKKSSFAKSVLIVHETGEIQ